VLPKRAGQRSQEPLKQPQRFPLRPRSSGRSVHNSPHCQWPRARTMPATTPPRARPRVSSMCSWTFRSIRNGMIRGRITITEYLRDWTRDGPPGTPGSYDSDRALRAPAAVGREADGDRRVLTQRTDPREQGKRSSGPRRATQRLAAAARRARERVQPVGRDQPTPLDAPSPHRAQFPSAGSSHPCLSVW
jgi:hypothetical protein